jgi:hypothetical protein
VMTQVKRAGKHIKKQCETVQIVCCPCVPARKFKNVFDVKFYFKGITRLVSDLRYKERLQLRVQFWIFTKFPFGLCVYYEQQPHKTLFIDHEI